MCTIHKTSQILYLIFCGPELSYLYNLEIYRREKGTQHTRTQTKIPRNIKRKYSVKTSSSRRQILLKLPGEALGRYLQFFILSPFDFDDRPARRADDPNAPRSERDTVRGQVEPQRSEVGTEEVLETRAGLHHVE